MTAFTDEERDTLRTAAFGSIALVSKAEPGFFAMFKESTAGSRALAAAPPEVRELFIAPGLPKPPTGSPDEVEAQVMDSLHRAISLLRGKAPEQVEAFRSVISSACDEVARASGGVSEQEAAMVQRIRSALGQGPQGTPAPVTPAQSTEAPGASSGQVQDVRTAGPGQLDSGNP